MDSTDARLEDVSIGTVIVWIKESVKSGALGESTGRALPSALRACVKASGCHTIGSMLAVVESLPSRLIDSGIKNTTAVNYVRATKWILTRYMRCSGVSGAPKSPKPARQKGETGAAQVTTIRLGDGRFAEFRLPRLTLSDVARVACHLAALCDDFDPLTQSLTVRIKNES